MAAAQNFDHAFQLIIPAKYGVQLAFLRKAGQVTAIFLTGAAAAGTAHAGAAGQNQLAGKLAAFPRGAWNFQPKARQPHAGRTGGIFQHGTEQVFVLRFVHAGGMGPQNSEFQRLAAFGRKVPAAQVQRAARAGPLGGTGRKCRYRDLFAAQKLHRSAPPGLQHGKQQVPGIHRRTPLPACDGDRGGDGAPCGAG